MNAHHTTTVYNFRLYPAGRAEHPELAPFKATAAAIALLGGDIVDGTAQDVPLDELDPDGRYSRRPTGWGDLG